MNEHPEPTVGALVFNKKNQLFLMTSPKWKGKYIIPGGHIEFGETIEQALKREIKEETNLDIYDLKFFNISEQINNTDFHTSKHFIFIDYLCKTNNQEKVKLNSEGGKFVWTTLQDAFNLPLANATKNLILKYQKQTS